eukprot:scpid100446/ scgid34615/ 
MTRGTCYSEMQYTRIFVFDSLPGNLPIHRLRSLQRQSKKRELCNRVGGLSTIHVSTGTTCNRRVRQLDMRERCRGKVIHVEHRCKCEVCSLQHNMHLEDM